MVVYCFAFFLLQNLLTETSSCDSQQGFPPGAPVGFFFSKDVTLRQQELQVSHERVVYFCLMTSGRALHTFHRTLKPNYPSYEGLI